MDRKTYFQMKEAGIDVSNLANIFENTSEADIFKQFHELQGSIELGHFKSKPEMKTQEQHEEYKRIAAAMTGQPYEKPEPSNLAAILSGSCSNDPELLKNMPAADCPDSLAPNGNVIRMNAIQGGKTAAWVDESMNKPEGYSEADIEEYKNKLIVAIKNREAGISRNPPHHIVLFSDEPDAIPIPYSSVLGNGTVRLKEIKEVGTAARGEQKFHSTHTNKRGSNYTPPKKKRKKR